MEILSSRNLSRACERGGRTVSVLGSEAESERQTPSPVSPIGANLSGHIDALSPGAGRAKLRLSRGLPRAFACDITPLNSRSSR
jgi:hypothetical protein